MQVFYETMGWTEAIEAAHKPERPKSRYPEELAKQTATTNEINRKNASPDERPSNR